MDADQLEPIPTKSFYGVKRYKYLDMALDDLEASETQDSVDIVVLPPNVDPQTDEEGEDDDYIQERENTLPRDVAGEVELHFEDNDSGSNYSDGSGSNYSDGSDYDSEDNVPLVVPQKRPSSQSTRTKKLAKKVPEPKWAQHPTKIDMPETNGFADRLEMMKHDLEHSGPMQIFEKMFDDVIFQHITDQTNLYSTQKNNHGFFVSTADLKIFFGILLLSGYHKLPRERLYWSLDEDLGVPFVSNAMSRNRFQEIKKYIHLANNDELDKDDKMAKIRPLMKLLNQNFQQYGVFHQELSIDEAMVKYFGHNSAKQFIRGKPVRFGYKDWMLCGSTSYCYAFDTYCGAKMPKNNTKDENLPLGSKVVLNLLETVAIPSDHIVYFDNYFTSHDLLKTLKERGQRATGTVRENRTKKCPLLPIKSFQKKDRGYFEHIHDSDSLLLFVRWKDNNVVTMATNYDSVEPMGQVRRWSTAAKAKVQVPQPKVFQNYNRGMGGVDLQDQAVNNYRINIRGKKWWWVLFTHMINVAIVNAWRLHQLASPEKMDLLAFQRDIARNYLLMFEKGDFSRTRPLGSVPDSIRLQEGGHFPSKLNKQLRCKECHES